MNRDRLFLAFVPHLGHQKMAHLVHVGYLWCSSSAFNRANAEVLWASEEVRNSMALTLGEHAQQPDTSTLRSWLETAMEHHPEVRSVEILGFQEDASTDSLFYDFGFRKVGPLVYERLPLATSCE